MAEVSDHLVPTDGLTNSSIRFDGLELQHDNGGGVDVRFGIYDSDKQHVGDFTIFVPPKHGHGADWVLAEAHRQMTDVLRQWLYQIDSMREHYEKRPGAGSQGKR